MNRNLAVPRRLLIGAGLLFPAMALATPGRQAAPGRKPMGEMPVPATEDLMREHGVLARVLLIYEAGARRLGQGEDIEPTIFVQAGEIMRDFVHDYHETSEEEQLFERFRKAGRMVELVDVLQLQHAAGRRLTEHLLQLAPNTTTKEKRSGMIEAMKASIALHRPHVAREDTDLFPTLRSLVTANTFDDISEALEKAEKAKLGGGGFESVVKRVEALEKRISTHDLSQFTPKI